MKHLGSLEQLLMLATARLGDEAHGLAIRRELERSMDRTVSPGAVYTTMDRLARHGLVAGRISDETPETGGRPRKFYRLTPRGARVLAENYERLTKLGRGMLPTLNRIAGNARG